MLPRESLNPRQDRRARRRTDLTALEALEERTLLSFTTLGYSLPDLTISGQAGPRAAWGGTLDVSVYLQNIGASSTTEPVSQLPATSAPTAGSLYNSTSSADAPDSTVEVLLTRTPKSLNGAVTLGTFQAGALNQNSIEQMTAPFTLPSRPKGFPGSGGTVYLWFIANSTDAFEESNFANNLSTPVAVHITGKALPELRAIALSVPSNLQPGDTIDPVATIENFGTADSGPVTVELVESATRKFNPLAVNPVLSTETIADIPGVSEVPTGGNYATFAQQLVTPPSNVVSVELLTTDDGFPRLSVPPPKVYYIGVLVNYDGTTKQLSMPRNALQQVRVVGPPSKTLSSSATVSNANTGVFPTAPTGNAVGVS